jgi:hypothetical protein
VERTRSAAEEAVFRTVRAKLGEAIRSQYELAQPLPDRLDALVAELRRRDDELDEERSSERAPSAGSSDRTTNK